MQINFKHLYRLYYHSYFKWTENHDKTAIYTFINAWNEFLYSLILINSTDKMTVSVALKSLQGAEILNWGDMMAASALVVVPSVIFFMFIQNKIAGGMTDGAVK